MNNAGTPVRRYDMAIQGFAIQGLGALYGGTPPLRSKGRTVQASPFRMGALARHPFRGIGPYRRSGKGGSPWA